MSTKSILIVEDDIGIRDVLKSVINSETSHQAFIAPDAEIALDMLHKMTPDLFLVDYRLPGLNGVEFVDRIRQDGYKKTPVILMTACILWEEAADVQILHKPFDLDIFLQIVGEMINIA